MKRIVNRRTALKIALIVKNHLKDLGRVKITGSLRRGKRRVGDIDILGTNPEMTTRFIRLGERIRGKEGGTRASITVSGVQIDLTIVPEDSWGTGQMHTTGSAKENIWLRGIAKHKGLTLNQYGLWTPEGVNLAHKSTERQVYGLLGVLYRSPSQRLGWEKV